MDIPGDGSLFYVIYILVQKGSHLGIRPHLFSPIVFADTSNGASVLNVQSEASVQSE